MSHIPQSFLCPISLQVMEEPVITADGHSFDRKHITAWIESEGICPMTRKPLRVEDLQDNRALRDAIQEFVFGMEEDVAALQLQSHSEPFNSSAAGADAMELEVQPDVTMELAACQDPDNPGLTLVDISLRLPEGNQTSPLDIVAVIDVSGSMCSAAKVQQGGESMDVGFSVLDVTKHALRTIVETMKPSDRLSIVSFSDCAKVICRLTPVTPQYKAELTRKIDSLSYGGSTNLWDGLRVGLCQFDDIAPSSSRMPAMLVLTDGMPSKHMLPTQGVRQALTKRLAKIKSDQCKKLPSICTFGFGYDLDSPLLADIAQIGGGHFSFIPDSGFVGTVLVNSLANLSTMSGTYAELSLEAENGAHIVNVAGYQSSYLNSQHVINLETLHLGQERRVLVRVEATKATEDYLCARLQYTNGSGERVLVQERISSLSCPLRKLEAGSSTSEELLRCEFVEMLGQVLRMNQFDESVAVSRRRLKESAVIVAKFESKHVNFQDHPIVQDARREVSIAVSQWEYFSRWGRNYILSLMSAHKQQRCNNFKDASVQGYGSDLFCQERDRADELFNNMPPPVPSRQSRADTTCSASSKSSRTAGRMSPTCSTHSAISMSIFNDASNGCFHADAMVHMADGSRKRCSEVRKGDVVIASEAEGTTATVQCVVRMECEEGMELMTTMESGLCITPWHPVKQGSEWFFPADLHGCINTACPAVYSFVLESCHSVTICGIECITLGHGRTESILNHHYFGTDRVINDLRRLPGFEEGVVDFRSGCVQRGFDGIILGFDPHRINYKSCGIVA